MSEEIELPRNLPFIGRKYPELEKANKREEGKTEEMLKENKKIAKEDVERSKQAIKEMQDEINEQNK